jgi:hypothetical protein
VQKTTEGTDDRTHLRELNESPLLPI